MAGVQQPHTGFTFKFNQIRMFVVGAKIWVNCVHSIQKSNLFVMICAELIWFRLKRGKKNERNEVMLKFKIWFNRWTRNQTESATNNRRLTNLPNYFFIKKTNERTKKPTNQLKKKILSLKRKQYKHRGRRFLVYTKKKKKLSHICIVFPLNSECAGCCLLVLRLSPSNLSIMYKMWFYRARFMLILCISFVTSDG